MKKLLAYSIIGFLQLFTSCQKEHVSTLENNKDIHPINILTNEEIKLIKIDSVEITKDGALNFLSHSAYFTAVRQLMNCSNIKLDLWEESIGFNSIRKVVNKIIDSSCLTPSIESYREIVAKNPSLVELGERGIEPLVKAAFYRNILNEENIFYIMGDKYKVTNEHVNIVFKNASINTKTSNQSLSFTYCETPIKTKANGPDKNLFTGTEGRYSNQISTIPGTSKEIWIESQYKVFRNMTAVSYYFPGSMDCSHRVYYDFYIQFDVWQWLYNFQNNNWAYYNPVYQLYLSDIKYHFIDDKTASNVTGNGGESHFIYSLLIGKGMEGVSIDQFPTKRPTPEEIDNKIPKRAVKYLNYKAGNTQYKANIEILYELKN